MAIKIIEVIGTSENSMEDAVKNAVSEASKTIRNISGVDVLGFTAKAQSGAIVSWSANVKIAFEVER
jgi:hypothetical protein